MKWKDLRDFINNLPPDSAIHRKMNPKSWWWTADVDFLAAILHSIQMGNWQRGEGKGSRPKPITRPRDGQGPKAPKSIAEAEARKKTVREELARRRKRKAV